MLPITACHPIQNHIHFLLLFFFRHGLSGGVASAVVNATAPVPSSAASHRRHRREGRKRRKTRGKVAAEAGVGR